MVEGSNTFLSQEFLSKYDGLQPRNKGILFEVLHLRSYARYLPELKRRETWLETVERVTNYSVGLYQGPASQEGLIKEAELMFDKVFHLEVLPAGRTLWIGGTDAAKKQNERNFNCSGLVISRIDDFCDIFHLLLCGCGVGYRILKDDVSALPLMSTNFGVIHKEYKPKHPSVREENTLINCGFESTFDFDLVKIEIGDSIEGWVKALRVFLHRLATNTGKYTVFLFNYDSIRPEGERIRTSGGIAPGPKGLEKMFTNIAKLIKDTGGCFTPVAAMDLANMISLNVIVGGTRRSAQIALGDPEDREFIEAKRNLYKQIDGNWIKDESREHRVMSNNSVVFTSKPPLEKIKEIFSNIRDNGEPGFFNLEAALSKRPKASTANPCVTSDTWVMTSNGPRQVRDLLGVPFKATVNSSDYNSLGFWKTGTKDVYKLKTTDGFELKLTKDHKVLTVKNKSHTWKEAKDLERGDEIVINNNRHVSPWLGEGSFEEGWVLGNFIGDGNFSGEHGSATMQYWGMYKEPMASQALKYLNLVTERKNKDSKSISICHREQADSLAITSARIRRLAEKWGLSCDHKVQVTPSIEKASYEFYRGFLQGLFDADGCPQGSKEKGYTVRLSQANRAFLQSVQRMLSHMGIVSTIPKVRSQAAMRLMPDGKGGKKEYLCQDIHELIISRDSMVLFNSLIGFSKPDKKEKLQNYINSLVRLPYKSRFEAKFESLEFIGQEDVYDCTVDIVHRFDANGLVIHNCLEILLANYGVCNLSTVVLPSHIENGKLNVEKLHESVRLATRIGLRQTNVTLSLPHWDEVQKRDRLTGVSFTGFMDLVDRLGWDHDSNQSKTMLEGMGFVANDEADRYSFEMRVPRPLLVTAIKPEGSLSLLPTVSPGLHRSYAPYYIRRVRVSALDPVCKALKELGVPNEPDKTKKDSSRVVFSFPIKSGAKTKANDETVSSQFTRYLNMQKYYTDHNSSCTLTVGEDEWESIAQEVYDNWDNVVACAFLPKEEGTYPQMPLESITEEEYNRLMISFPDLSQLSDIVNKYEKGLEFELDALGSSDCSANGSCPLK